MASLRRPSAAIPRGPASVQFDREARPPLPSDNKQNRMSKVGEKIKKRLSMRYGGNESFSVAPPLPGTSDFLTADPYGGLDIVTPGEDLADSPFGLYDTSDLKESIIQSSQPLDTQEHLADESIRRRGAADATLEEEWNLEELSNEKIDAQAYAKKVLTGADEEEKRKFVAALMREKQANKKELQRTVFKHYAEFVAISKEISTLENDMLELKELLGQWKDLPQLMGMEDTLAPTLDRNGNLERRRTQRNSVFDLQNLYRNQLTQLWSIVEGSQKYLPVVPGRHLVFELHGVVELNPATYKPKQNVNIFLLNDVLLIAGKRRNKGSSATGMGVEKDRDRGRMVAERCWNLVELGIVDVKDGGELVNVIKVHRGKEHCVYRTQKSDDKRALINAFRQISREANEKKRKDSEKEQERRKTMWLGDKSGNGIGNPGHPLSAVGLSMTDSKDLRWIDEYGDELTMAIAIRDWEESVKLVEKGQALSKSIESNSSAHSLLVSRLEQLVPSLVSQISHDLSSSNLRKSSSARLISLLVRLDLADHARDSFLESRKELMFKRVRSIKCDGDVSIYINELAVVIFTIIRHTSDWYMNAFKENKMASGFVTWAKQQIETFAELFKRQVDAPNISESIVNECLHVTATQNRKLLRDVGLDFTFLLSSLLRPSSNPSDHPHSVFTSLSPLPGKNLEAASYFGSSPATEGSISGAGRSSSMLRERSNSSTKNSVAPLDPPSRLRMPSV
ncbi:exocyst complex component EXO84 [Cryptococcus neoformans]|nr:exocyst complex component EXO84 [Cryptococcus neoformans var. grubii]